MDKMSSIMMRLFDEKLAKQGFYDRRMVTDWSDIALDDCAKYTPNKIKHTKNGQKTLYLTPASLGDIAEFNYIKQNLMDRINMYFGKEMVQSIRLTSIK